MPLLTIITPSKNHLAGLRSCRESLARQSFRDWEHLIIDSASTDGTVEYAQDLPQTRIISEPDNSLEFALNKGLKLATGKYVTFLLCYDSFIDPDWLKNALDFLEGAPNYSMISGCTGAEVTDVNYGYDSYPSGPKFSYYFFIAPWPILNETAFICPRSILLEHFPNFQEASRRQDIFFHFWINFFRAGYVAGFHHHAVIHCDLHATSRLVAQLNSGEFRDKEHDFMDHKRVARQRLVQGKDRLVFRDQEGQPLPINFSWTRFILAISYYKIAVFFLKKILRRKIPKMQYDYCQALCRKCIDWAF
jgi:glycosyltransferase involved in cell wall biosynthesis